MPPHVVSQKILTDDIFASNAQYPEGDDPVVAISSGPGVIASDEKDAAWRNQDGYFIEYFPRLAAHVLPFLFHQAAARVQAALTKHDKDKGGMNCDTDSGCTALVCLVQEQKVIVAHAGDCFATLIYKKNGMYTALQLTRPHRANIETEKRRIKKSGSLLKISAPIIGSPRLCLDDKEAHANRGLAITRGLGASAYADAFTATPEVSIFDLKLIDSPHDAFIVTGSDGFSDYVNDDELVKFFNENSNLSLPEKAHALRQKAYLENGSPDNITVGVNTLHAGLGVGIFDGFGIWGRVATESAAEYFNLVRLIAEALAILDFNRNTALKKQLATLRRQLRSELVRDLSLNADNLPQHPCIQLAKATKNMLDIVMDTTKNDSEKMLAIHCYHMTYSKSPHFKKYQRLIFIITCTVIGMLIGAIVGGLLSAPIFGAGATVGAIAGGSIGAGLANGAADITAGLHYMYHQRPLIAANAAIQDVVNYPSKKKY